MNHARSGRSAGLRRVLIGVASAALVGTAFVPAGAATAAGDSPKPLLKDRHDSAKKAAADKFKKAPEGSRGFSPDRHVKDAWLVQLSGQPVVKGGSTSSVSSVQGRFAQAVKSVGNDAKITQKYGKLWNGVSVRATQAQMEKLAESKDVVAVYPVVEVQRPKDQKASGDVKPQMLGARSMTGADVMQERGITGKGVKIGIVDTGVDYDHPDFGGSGTAGGTDFPTKKVAYGYDFVGDAYNANPTSPNYDPVPKPDEDPDDCGAHGTHVAGIAAANGPANDSDRVRGVAPDATLGAYRVFGCEGSTNNDIIIAALEKAWTDGMDVVNLSLGSPLDGWAEDPTAVTADAMSKSGVVVTFAAGNDSAYGDYSAGSPGSSLESIGVASFENTSMKMRYFSSDGNEVALVDGSDDGGDIPTSGSGTLAVPQAGNEQGCEPITEDLTGKYVLVERGTCAFGEKGAIAQEAGAEGILIYNNAPGYLSPTFAHDPAVTIPGAIISQEDGATLVEKVANDPAASIDFAKGTTDVDNPAGGLLSDFSSLGALADLRMKPDLGAPGGNIYSTVPLESGGYGTMSGTSMAAPHTAGAAALLLQEHPDWKPDHLRDRLMNSGRPQAFHLMPDLGLPDFVHAQGSGLIDIPSANDAPTTASPSKVELGQTTPGSPVSHTVTLTNTSSEDVTYQVSKEDGVASGGDDVYYPDLFGAQTAVEMPSEVTVPAGGSKDVKLTFDAPTGVNLQYGGFITFASTNDSGNLTVPFGGFSGDFADREALIAPYVYVEDADGKMVREPVADLPALAKLTNCGFVYRNECIRDGEYSLHTSSPDEPYTLKDGDIPTIAVHLQYAAPQMVMNVYKAEGGQKGEKVFTSTDKRLARSVATSDWSPVSWDGFLLDRGEPVPAPDGDYIMEIVLTRATAFNDEREAPTETFETPAFTIGNADDSYSPNVDRYEGVNRWSTSTRIAQQYGTDVDTVYVASGEDFPDALTGAAPAGMEGAPILLTKKDGVPTATRGQLENMRPKKIVLLGGDSVASSAVERQLSKYAPVTRISGAHRWSTAVEISQLVEDAATKPINRVYIASGENFPDALSGGAQAAAKDSPVLLTKKDSLPAVTAARLKELKPKEIVLLGGTSAISTQVKSKLGQYGTVKRVFAADRYATSAAVSKFGNPTSDTLFIASGATFPDALSGSPLAGWKKASMLLVRPGSDNIPSAVNAEIDRLKPRNVVILGGLDAVSEEIQKDIEGRTYTP